VFTNVINPRSEVNRKAEYKTTIVKRGATVGANATIVCGATIGEYSFVAAGAVVRGDVEPYALVAGVPAVRKGWVCRCGARLRADPTVSVGFWVRCDSCTAEFVAVDGGAALRMAREVEAGVVTPRRDDDVDGAGE
jgi:UDP-2-acetamido-3-amino-2,3-dideoxy-glucuronate N-acetyltransferase